MTALQRQAADAPGAEQELVNSIRKHGRVRRVLRNIGSYLSDARAKSLLGQVLAIAHAQPEVPFSYRYAYAPPRLLGARAPSPEPLGSAWDRVGFR